jgi:hypothetical protein
MEDGDSGIIGKKKMDFKVYENICELFMPEEGEEYLFAHCFLTLEWNLKDDRLAFRFAKSKMDQMGRNSDQVWHVYATPNNSCVCPVLALATYNFANPSLTNVENFTEADEDGNVSGRLFPGGDQYGWFMDCLRRVVEKNKGVSCTWNSPRQFGLAFCAEGGMQFCGGGKHSLPTDGLHLLMGNVEYGVRKGALPPV